MEALACGLPVVATNVGGIPDIVECSKTGILVDRGNVQALAEALVSVLQDSDLRARMGEAAHEFARTHLDARKTGDRLVGLYRELIGPS
jgi:starch synthase